MRAASSGNSRRSRGAGSDLRERAVAQALAKGANESGSGCRGALHDVWKRRARAGERFLLSRRPPRCVEAPREAVPRRALAREFCCVATPTRTISLWRGREVRRPDGRARGPLLPRPRTPPRPRRGVRAPRGGGREACVALPRSRPQFASVQASGAIRPARQRNTVLLRRHVWAARRCPPGLPCGRCAGGTADFAAVGARRRCCGPSTSPRETRGAIAALCSRVLVLRAARALAARVCGAPRARPAPARRPADDFPVPFSKTVLQRLARLAYRWIWWIDCDTLLLDPSVGMAQLLAAHGIRDGASGKRSSSARTSRGAGSRSTASRRATRSTRAPSSCAAAPGEALLNEWVEACPAVRGRAHKQALWHILAPSASAAASGARSHRATARSASLPTPPSIPSHAQPSARSRGRRCCCVVRGEVSTGRCSPRCAAKRKARCCASRGRASSSRASRSMGWSVRDRCCGGRLSERLYKRLWAARSAPPAPDVWPREVGRATSLATCRCATWRGGSRCAASPATSPRWARLAPAVAGGPRRRPGWPGGKGKARARQSAAPGAASRRVRPVGVRPEMLQYYERQHPKRRRAKGR